MLKSVLLFFGFWALLFFWSIIAVIFVGNENENITIFLSLFSFFGAPIVSFLFVKWKTRKDAADLLNSETAVAERAQRLDQRRFIERTRIDEAVALHKAALIRNISRAKVVNDYGVVISDESAKAILEFLNSISLDRTAFENWEAKQIVRSSLELEFQDERNMGFDSSSIPVDGLEFERWVAASLEKFGWEATLTAGSKDQGIDVIALKDDIKLGIQCKLYSGSVGNKAVQEALAGKAYHGLNKIAVLTNSEFTQSARDLAVMNNVALVSHHDIPALETKLTR